MSNDGAVVEPLNRLFGSKTKHVELDNGDSLEQVEVIKDAKTVASYTRHCENTKVDNEQQVLKEFIALLNYVRADKRLFDPEFRTKTDRKTGKTYLVQKLWSEPE